MSSCEFDRLFKLTVPHIHERSFLSLDYTSFKRCMRVCRSWNDQLTLVFPKDGKSAFCESIQEELVQVADGGP